MDCEGNGTVVHGAIVLDGPLALPDGTRVMVRAAVQEAQKKTAPGGFSPEFLAFAGSLDGFPEDFSENLDHYLYGTPKD
jgi:hypothetical protein